MGKGGITLFDLALRQKTLSIFARLWAIGVNRRSRNVILSKRLALAASAVEGSTRSDFLMRRAKTNRFA